MLTVNGFLYLVFVCVLRVSSEHAYKSEPRICDTHSTYILFVSMTHTSPVIFRSYVECKEQVLHINIFQENCSCVWSFLLLFLARNVFSALILICLKCVWTLVRVISLLLFVGCGRCKWKENKYVWSINICHRASGIFLK